MSERDKRSDKVPCKYGFSHCFCGYGDQPNHHRSTTSPTVKIKPSYKPLATTNAFELDVVATAKTLTDLLIRKHKDYGPLNVAAAPGGALNGLRVRIHDKTARINHLIDSGATPENESLRDSFADLANYALIALLVLDGKWPNK